MIAGGLLTRSRTAKAIGVLTLTTIALVSAVTRFGVPVPLLGSLIGWVLPGTIKVLLGVWAARALRRRLDPTAD